MGDEVLAIDDEIRDAIVSDPSVANLRRLAVQHGMVQLHQDGFRKVREGITTIEEILQIAGDVTA